MPLLRAGQYARRIVLSFPRPVGSLAPNTFEFETLPLVKPTGFREYDARWWFGHPGSSRPPDINLMGVTALGLGLGTYLHEAGVGPDIVTAHDFRSYSSSIKTALVAGLISAGCRVHDIGLAVSPMAYFAQFDLDVPSVAMVTASHNENGWTGVKLGCERPVTFGPDEMARLKELVLGGLWQTRPGGSYQVVTGMAQRYKDDLAAQPLARRLKVVVATGNGTAGAFAPDVLEAAGCEVIRLHTELDHNFPNYNPNPEDMRMLHDVADVVRANSADIGLAFDGDGDRCGVIDNDGNEIFADKVGLMLARDIAARQSGARFVVDVKSTGLYATDPELARLGATTDYWKTGHSYIKRRVRETGATVGFEKSGHYFFNAPLGRGYDDAQVSALAICTMLADAGARTMADLYRELPRSWGSPTMSATCPDELKYDVADRVRGRFEAMHAEGAMIDGHRIAELITVNGVRVVADDGSWGLVRASSNKPEIVVVVESPVSEARMRDMFRAVDTVLRESDEVGDYNQTI